MSEIVRLAADDRSRVAIARLGVRPRDEFQAEVEEDGRIILTPVAFIPKREMIVWDNPDVRQSILTGLAESAAGVAFHDPSLDAALNDLEDSDE